MVDSTTTQQRFLSWPKPSRMGATSVHCTVHIPGKVRCYYSRAVLRKIFYGFTFCGHEGRSSRAFVANSRNISRSLNPYSVASHCMELGHRPPRHPSHPKNKQRRRLKDKATEHNDNKDLKDSQLRLNE